MTTVSAAAACLVVLAVLLLPSAAQYVKYKDAKQPINERVQDLLGRMTLEEKIGQMSQIERANATAEVIEKYFVGQYSITGGRRSAGWRAVIYRILVLSCRDI